MSTNSVAAEVSVKVSVNRRGGGGGHGGGGHSSGGGHAGGHESSVGVHGNGNGEHGNLPDTQTGSVIPLYGAAGAMDRNNYNHHGSTSNGILNYVCFYHYFLLLISIVIGVFL